MITLYTSIICLSLLLVIASCSGGDDDGKDYTVATFTLVGNVLHMNGEIDSTTPNTLREVIASNHAVKKIIMLKVPGSVDDAAAFDTGRIVRDNKIATHLTASSVIESGGVDFFIGGSKRTMEQGAKIGVHSWSEGDGGLRGDQLADGHAEHQPYIDYYDEMGITKVVNGKSFYKFTITQAPPDNIYYMSADDIEDYGLLTE